MPGYYTEGLTRCHHEAPGRLMDQLHKHVQRIYGAAVQYAKDVDTSPKLGSEDKIFIQQVTGTFLYYAHTVDATILVALSVIASEQSNPTAETKRMLESS